MNPKADDEGINQFTQFTPKKTTRNEESLF